MESEGNDLKFNITKARKKTDKLQKVLVPKEEKKKKKEIKKDNKKDNIFIDSFIFPFFSLESIKIFPRDLVNLIIQLLFHISWYLEWDAKFLFNEFEVDFIKYSEALAENPIGKKKNQFANLELDNPNILLKKNKSDPMYFGYEVLRRSGYKGILLNNKMTLINDKKYHFCTSSYINRTALNRPMEYGVFDIYYQIDYCNPAGGAIMECVICPPEYYTDWARKGSHTEARDAKNTLGFSYEGGSGKWFGSFPQCMNPIKISGYKSGEIIIARVDMNNKLFSFYQSDPQSNKPVVSRNNLIASCKFIWPRVVIFFSVGSKTYSVSVTLLTLRTYTNLTY
jgi:hypothetical protein